MRVAAVVLLCAAAAQGLVCGGQNCSSGDTCAYTTAGQHRCVAPTAAYGCRGIICPEGHHCAYDSLTQNVQCAATAGAPCDNATTLCDQGLAGCFELDGAGVCTEPLERVVCSRLSCASGEFCRIDRTMLQAVCVAASSRSCADTPCLESEACLASAFDTAPVCVSGVAACAKHICPYGQHCRVDNGTVSCAETSTSPCTHAASVCPAVGLERCIEADGQAVCAPSLHHAACAGVSCANGLYCAVDRDALQAVCLPSDGTPCNDVLCGDSVCLIPDLPGMRRGVCRDAPKPCDPSPCAVGYECIVQGGQAVCRNAMESCNKVTCADGQSCSISAERGTGVCTVLADVYDCLGLLCPEGQHCRHSSSTGSSECVPTQGSACGADRAACGDASLSHCAEVGGLGLCIGSPLQHACSRMTCPEGETCGADLSLGKAVCRGPGSSGLSTTVLVAIIVASVGVALLLVAGVVVTFCCKARRPAHLKSVSDESCEPSHVASDANAPYAV